MKKTVTFLMMMLLYATLSAQTVTLTFTAQDAYGQYVQIDRVVVTNQTKGWQEIIQWPDTTFLMQNSLGVDDYSGMREFALSQNNPNPFGTTTDVELAVVEEGGVSIEISDINGRLVVANQYSSMQPGIHRFRVSMANGGLYVLTARQNKKTSAIKMVCKEGGASNAIDYVGEAQVASIVLKAGTNNQFEYGDMMQYVAYTHEGNTEVASQPLTQVQLEPQNIVLSFAGAAAGDGLPCLGAVTVSDHESNAYNTVRIGTQCWTKENMRCTTSPNGYLAFGGTDTSDYNIISSYAAYYYDFTLSPIPFDVRGLLYNWAGALDTTSIDSINESFSGRRGICPAGWHVPSMDEWNLLTNYLGSLSEFQCGALDHGYIAKSLASQNYWESATSPCSPGYDTASNNATGFSAVPVGAHLYQSQFVWSGMNACFWASSCYSNVKPDNLFVYNRYPFCGRPDPTKDEGLSVRCLRD